LLRVSTLWILCTNSNYLPSHSALFLSARAIWFRVR
jgi:hypothetical protein